MTDEERDLNRAASNESHEQARMLYQVSADNIRSFQDRQTALANYAGLIFAALIGFSIAMPESTRSFGTALVLSALTVSIGVAAAIWMNRLQNAIYHARKLTVDLRARHFTEDIRLLFVEKPLSRVEEADTLSILLGIVLVGACLTMLGLVVLNTSARH